MTLTLFAPEHTQHRITWEDVNPKENKFQSNSIFLVVFLFGTPSTCLIDAYNRHGDDDGDHNARHLESD